MNRHKLILGFCLLLAAAAAADIAQTRHNLSITGTGTIKANIESEICVFCHVPHRANPAKPLWNHSDTTQVFTPYDQSISATLKSRPGQPDGSSKLCLGCHDGTVAVGSTISGGMISGLEGSLSGTKSLGANLSGSHPISFVYDAALVAANGELANPAALSHNVKLDGNSKLQCISCHDPHDDTYGNFLVTSNTAGELCTTCHNKTGWNTSIHQTSACGSCHQPHAATAVPLLKQPQIDQCYSCHGAIEFEFAGNQTMTGIGGAGTYSTINTKHDVSSSDHTYSGSKLTCGNCHNPHAVKQKTGSGAAIDSLVDPDDRAQLWTGAGATNSRDSINNFCLRCHDGTFPVDVANPAQGIGPTSAMINIYSAYQTDRHGNGSRRGTTVPALACTECHETHGSHYTDQAWNGNVYSLKNRVDGTIYVDNGAGGILGWPVVAATSSYGVVKDVRINPSQINMDTDLSQNTLNNLCVACHSKTSGPGGFPHIAIGGAIYSKCTNCHRHGNPSTSGGL